MTRSLVGSTTPAAFAEILRRTGYRAAVVEQQGRVQVQSAAQGLGFFVAFGNPDPGAPGSHVDIAFHCLMTIQGELPAGLVERWNREMRFARLYRQDDFLVLCMDVMLAGGVSEEFLCAQCELWDRVIRDFILRIRRVPGEAEAASAAGGGA
jgi:hypothetical protein